MTARLALQIANPQQTCKSQRTARIGCLTLSLLFYFADAGFQGLQGEVGLLFVDDQRRGEADSVGAGAEDEQALVEGEVDDRAAQVGGFFLSALVADDFDADHETAAANVAHDFEFFGPVGHAREEIVAHAARVLFVLGFDEFHGGERGGDAHGIAAERAAVRAGLPGVHDAAARDECAEGHAAGDALGATENVRLDAGMLAGTPLARAAHAALHFVDHEHDAVLAANALEFLQEELRRGDVATFALDRLDHNGGDFLRIKEALEDLALERFEDFGAACFGAVTVFAAVGIRVGNVLDAGEERAEAFALRGF